MYTVRDDAEFAALHALLREHDVSIIMAGDTDDLEYYSERPDDSSQTAQHFSSAVTSLLCKIPIDTTLSNINIIKDAALARDLINEIYLAQDALRFFGLVSCVAYDPLSSKLGLC